MVRPLPDNNPGYSQHGIEYHLHDFVYVTPAQDGPYDIGQITRVEIVDEMGSYQHVYLAKVVLQVYERPSVTCKGCKEEEPSQTTANPVGTHLRDVLSLTFYYPAPIVQIVQDKSGVQ